MWCSRGRALSANSQRPIQRLVRKDLSKDRRDRDAVHKVNFDFKVVETPFFFCRGIENEAVMGCAFDPPPPPAEQRPQHQSMIVGNTSDLKLTAKIWAHEFGRQEGFSASE